MSDLRIVDLDVADPAAFAAWHHVYAATEQHDRGEHATTWQLEELHVLMSESSSRARYVGWSGLVGDEVVAHGGMRLSMLDNLDRAEVSVHVLPEHRRRGHGTAVLQHAEQAARAHGRRVVGGETSYPYDSGPEGTGQPGPEFARARGYDLALGEVQRVLRLPVADELLDRLAAEAAPHHAAYTLRSWVGPVPDDLAQGWAELTATLNTEAPVGGLDIEDETASVEALREAEAVTAKQGRTKYNTVALDRTGAVVAYTDIAVSSHEGSRAYQWGTLVRPEDRGHRLGLAVKVANLRLLQAEQPDARQVVTWNAEVNGHMIGVNEELGYRAVERAAQLQKRLA